MPHLRHDVDSGDGTARGTDEFHAAEDEQKYFCPMHPEVISDEPGKCPKCGMDLVPMEK